jgi:hypothetical protein
MCIMKSLSTIPMGSGVALILMQMPLAAQVCPHGIDQCLSGYVWREASPSDRVCVTEAVRAQAAQDNAQAASRRDPAGPWGPDGCQFGYVWREAFPNDHVCVPVLLRAAAARDNAEAASRRDPACTPGVTVRDYLDGLPIMPLIKRVSGTLEPVPNAPEGVSGSRLAGGTFVNDQTELAILKTFPDVIWPGSLVQGRSINNNEFAPIALPRAPGRIRVATEFVTGTSAVKYKDLPKVDGGAVDGAREEIIRSLNAEDSVGSMALSHAVASTAREGMVKLGIAYKGASFQGDASASLNQAYNENTIYAKFTQVFYGVTFEPDPAAADPFFASGVTVSDVARWAQPENPPLYISEVKYGRILLLSFTAAMSKKDIEAAVNASYSGFKGAFGASLKDRVNRMRIEVLSVGATGEVARAPLLITGLDTVADALAKYIDAGLKYKISTNPGAPIAFTMRYVGSRGAAHGPLTLAVAQMITDNSPEVVSLTAREVCRGPFEVWDGPGGGWRETGLDVGPGDKVRFGASGQNWSGVLGSGLYGPTGWYTWEKPSGNSFPINNRSPFALIARFGGQNNFGYDKTGGAPSVGNDASSSFFVGDSAEVVAGQDPTPGIGGVFLGTNDDNPTNGDKSKIFNVNVCITRKIWD